MSDLPGEEKYNSEPDFDRIVKEVATELKRQIMADLEPIKTEMDKLLAEAKRLSKKIALLEIEEARRQSWKN